jgi:hypothetical protein
MLILQRNTEKAKDPNTPNIKRFNMNSSKSSSNSRAIHHMYTTLTLTICGFPTKAFATLKRRFIPPLYLPHCLSAANVNFTSANTDLTSCTNLLPDSPAFAIEAKEESEESEEVTKEKSILEQNAPIKRTIANQNKTININQNHKPQTTNHKPKTIYINHEHEP